MFGICRLFDLLCVYLSQLLVLVARALLIVKKVHTLNIGPEELYIQKMLKKNFLSSHTQPPGDTATHANGLYSPSHSVHIINEMLRCYVYNVLYRPSYDIHRWAISSRGPET